MRTIAAILIAAIVVLLLSGFVVIYAGIYDVAATAPHWRVTVWLIETARLCSEGCSVTDCSAVAWSLLPAVSDVRPGSAPQS